MSDVSKVHIYTDLVGDIELWLPTPDGYQQLISGLSVSAFPNGSLISINADLINGFHDAKIISGESERIVQLVKYEDLKSCLSETENYGFSFYIFAKSDIVGNQITFHPEIKIRNKNLDDYEITRCDVGRYGAIPFDVGTNPYDVVKFFNVLNYSGVGHIIRVETKNVDNQNPYHHSRYTAARTFSGVLKLIRDWSEVSQSPFNNEEPIAIAANNFINNFPFPDGLLNSVYQSQPEMQIERYIRSGTDNFIIEENRIMPDVLRQYLLSNCCYKSLTTLVSNHPNPPNISSEVLLQEQNEAESVIYMYCLRNDIDIANSTLDVVKNHIENTVSTDNYEYTISPIDALERLMK